MATTGFEIAFTKDLNLTEEELFQLFDLAVTHGAQPEISEKLAVACRRIMLEKSASKLISFPRFETVQG